MYVNGTTAIDMPRVILHTPFKRAVRLPLPPVAGPIFSWYVSNNLVEGACPDCGSPAQVLKGQRGNCMYCGASYGSELQNGVFMRNGGGAASRDGVVEVEVLTDDDY